MAGLSMQSILQATHGTLLAGSAQGFAASMSIDSRTLSAGDLFFALRGPNFDGHQFVAEAWRKGACGAVVSETPTEFRAPGEGTLILVSDTTRALQAVGHRARTDWAGPLVAVTGSTGKTTTKDMIARVLERRGDVLKTQGNLNNHYGLPLTLFRLDAAHKVAVVEMGMNHAGEIARLCEIAAPNVGVYTNVGPVHLENFDSIEGIAAAKGELADYLNPAGTVIINADDPLVRKIGETFRGDRISYAVDDPADVRAESITTDTLGSTRFIIRHQGRSVAAHIPLLGRHNVYNALAAAATGLLFKLDLETIAEQLAGMAPSGMRGDILLFADGFTLIDDSYNSNPKALHEMVETLRRLDGFKRRIIAAGSMLELGPQSRDLHHECGTFIARAGIEELICVGDEARPMMDGALAGGLSPDRVHFFRDAVSAGAFLCTLIGPGDLLLVKGSRGIRMDRAVAKVKESFKLRGV